MSLEDLKKGIYRPSIENTMKERLDYKFENTNQNVVLKKPLLTLSTKKKLKIALVALGVFLVILFSSIWLISKNSFDQNKVTLEILGPQKIESGELLKYDFHIKNSNHIALENSILNIEYPIGTTLQNPEKKETKEAFSPGQIKGQEEKVFGVYVKIFGPEGNKALIKASFSYVPARLNARLEKNTDLAIDIISSPFKIVIDEPKIVTLNKNVVYTISFSNQSNDIFENIRLNLSYPTGFVIKEFSPRPPDIADHSWSFEKIMPQEQQEIKITGALTQNLDIINLGAAIELKNADGAYETYAQAFSTISITPAPISLNVQPTGLSITNIVNPGSGLGLRINFQNITDSVLKDITLALSLIGDIIDKDSVMPSDQGIYLKDENKIVWDSRRIPQLAILGAFEAGSASVNFRIKPSMALNNYNDKNFTFRAKASIRPEIVPPELAGIELENSTETSDIKLNSVLRLTGRIISQSTSPLTTSGPYPPAAGEKSTYLISWQLLNYYNDLSNVNVESYLPKGVDWEKEIWPKDSNVTFNPLTGKIVWQLSELKAGTGFTSPVKQVIFKVSAIPSPTQVGEKLNLLDQSTASAIDNFTKQNLSSSIEPLWSDREVAQ